MSLVTVNVGGHAAVASDLVFASLAAFVLTFGGQWYLDGSRISGWASFASTSVGDSGLRNSDSHRDVLSEHISRARCFSRCQMTMRGTRQPRVCRHRCYHSTDGRCSLTQLDPSFPELSKIIPRENKQGRDSVDLTLQVYATLSYDDSVSLNWFLVDQPDGVLREISNKSRSLQPVCLVFGRYFANTFVLFAETTSLAWTESDKYMLSTVVILCVDETGLRAQRTVKLSQIITTTFDRVLILVFGHSHYQYMVEMAANIPHGYRDVTSKGLWCTGVCLLVVCLEARCLSGGKDSIGTVVTRCCRHALATVARCCSRVLLVVYSLRRDVAYGQ